MTEPLSAADERMLREAHELPLHRKHAPACYDCQWLATLDAARSQAVPPSEGLDGREHVEQALWDRFTPGEKLAYGVGYRRGRALSPVPESTEGRTTDD